MISHKIEIRMEILEEFLNMKRDKQSRKLLRQLREKMIFIAQFVDHFMTFQWSFGKYS